MSLVPVRIRNNLVPKYKQILSTNPFLSFIFFYIFLSLSLSFNHLSRYNYCNIDFGPFYGTGTKDLKYSFNSNGCGSLFLGSDFNLTDSRSNFLSTGYEFKSDRTESDYERCGCSVIKLTSIPTCIRYGYSVIELGPYFDPLSEGLLRCFVIGTGLALNLCYACLTLECEKINLNARNCCLLSVIFIFSCIRSHFFPVIGRQQLNYARICCFFRVISISSWIRSHFNSFSACLGAAPDTTTLVTLEVQSPGGNDSVSLVQVWCRIFIFIFITMNSSISGTGLV